MTLVFTMTGGSMLRATPNEMRIAYKLKNEKCIKECSICLPYVYILARYTDIYSIYISIENWTSCVCRRMTLIAFCFCLMMQC